MDSSFSAQLKHLRNQAQLTNNELAGLAAVPESLISGLQNNNRRVGELQARKIARALHLTGDALERFVYAAIDTSTVKILKEVQPYPAQLLNLLGLQLLSAGISPESINDLSVANDGAGHDITLFLEDGQQATLKTQLVRA